MPRVYQRKTNRASYGARVLQDALQAIQDGIPLKTVSRNYGVPCKTLRRHRDGKVKNPGAALLGRFRPDFDENLEAMLVSHIRAMEKALFGLTLVDVRRLAFDFAEKMKINHRFCKTSKMAGKDWLAGFLRRNPTLSIRKPEATSMARAVGFNRPQVNQFFKVYRDELSKSNNYSPRQVWNMDETGIKNVQNPGKIVATKGAKSIGRITSAERGQTTSVLCAVNAAGAYIPPMFVFARKRMTPLLMTGCPPGSTSTCTANGWSDADCFLLWLQHFVTHAKPTRDEKHIIILDGHHSHKTLAAIDFARENGIVLITLPPHCTHKMQPLDVSYFKSLKAAYNRAADNWMLVNAGKRISQFNVAEIFGTAYMKTATIDKAINGFRATGIWPFNDDVFTDEDFVPAQLTEEPPPTAARNDNNNPPNENQDGEETPTTNNIGDVSLHNLCDSNIQEPQAGTSTDGEAKRLLTSLCSPPQPSEKRTRKRKAQKSEVITSSPYKKQLLDKNATSKTSAKGKGKAPKKSKKIPSPVSSDEEWPCLVCGAPFGTSRPSEQWVQCTTCKKWSHEDCTPGFDWYVCHNCESDED